MLPAVILAAGESRRMGSPKALLATPDGRPFIVAITATLAAAGITDIVVVSGRDHDLIAEAIATGRLSAVPRLVRNPDPARGQLSSLLTGMDAAVTPTTQGLVMTLVDVPMVRVETVERIVAEWRRSRAPIVRPAIGDRHGHPVIFDRSVFDELRAASLELGAKTIIRRHAAEVADVVVADPGCLVDVDTPADYDALRR
jgi:molybdenum cofactor cytidylyltransferase